VNVKSYTVNDGQQAKVGDTALVFDELATVTAIRQDGWNTKITVKHNVTGEELELWPDEVEVVA